MDEAAFDFDIETPDLRALLSGLREFEPRLATNLRRQLRAAGEEIIDEQRRELGPSESEEQIRDQIAAGLKTRITAGKTRQGVAIRSTGPRREGTNLARLFEKRSWRHRVFGSDQWVEQQGYPYFFEPVTDELRTDMKDRIDDAVQDALRTVTT